jgi:hypothetical protein
LDCLRFSKYTKISNLVKIRPLAAKLFHADRHTYMTKLTVVFRNFANAPETGLHRISTETSVAKAFRIYNSLLPINK